MSSAILVLFPFLLLLAFDELVNEKIEEKWQNVKIWIMDLKVK